MSVLKPPKAPDPDYRFTKMLPRKTESVSKRDAVLECQVNDYRAPVSWFRGDVKLEEDKFDGRYLVSKDFVGNCRLTIVDATKEDAGTYKCAIDGTKSVTKGMLKIRGSWTVETWNLDNMDSTDGHNGS